MGEVSRKGAHFFPAKEVRNQTSAPAYSRHEDREVIDLFPNLFEVAIATGVLLHAVDLYGSIARD
jgi:hypothetical protein